MNAITARFGAALLAIGLLAVLTPTSFPRDAQTPAPSPSSTSAIAGATAGPGGEAGVAAGLAVRATRKQLS